MFYSLKKEAMLGLCFGALLCLTATTATEAFAGGPQIEAGRAHSLTLDVYGSAFGWGENLDGQSSPPVPATGYVDIVAGGDHNLAIKTDGTVVEWGFDVTADPGFGLPLPKARPALNGVIDVAGGASFSAAVLLDPYTTTPLDPYTVTVWGDKSAGLTTVPAAALTGVAAIAAGDAHILALKSDGTIVGWGDDTFSQATGGAGLTGIVAVAAGSSHSLALKSGGTVVGWGDNTNGQITIPGGLTGVTAIAANSLYSMALKSDGTVAVWGIAPGSAVSITAIPAVLTNAATANIVAIAAGGLHAMALINDGTIVAWGDDFAGQVTGATGVNIGVAAGSVDATPPVITLNGSTPVIHSVGTPYIDAGAKVTDNVDATITNLAGASTVIDSTVGNYTVTYTHSDVATNPAIPVVRVVNVVDKTPPLITILGSNPATTEGGLAYIDAGATVTDNVDATIPFLAGVSDVYTNVVGTYSVIYNHKDDGLNDALPKTRTVNVVDTTAPVIAPLVDIYAEATALATPITLTNPIVIDVSAVTFANNVPAAVFPLGTTLVKWTATDIYSHASTATQNVVISDTTAPVINGGAALADIYTAVTNTNGQADTYTAVSLVAPNATDIFGATVSHNAPATGFPLGTTVVLWTAVDGNNTSTASQKVIVQDKTAPVITLNLPTDPYQRPAVGLNTIEVDLGAVYIDAYATVTDNVDATNTNLVGVGAVNASVVGSYPIIYNYIDTSKNPAIPVTRTVKVVDRVAPFITLNAAPRIEQIAAGGGHTAVLKNDGTMIMWGGNAYGQASVPSGLNDVSSIAAGEDHSVVLKNDGTVVAWGQNHLGQATVPAGLSGVLAVAAGRYHSVALKNDGTVVAWGHNGYGNQATVPASLTNPSTANVTAISAGTHNTLALRKDGTVVAWGSNLYGQINVPAALTQAGTANVTAIASGGYFYAALKGDGTVVAWGSNIAGQLNIPADLIGVKALSAGYNHMLALKNDGKVVAWGSNRTGQINVPAGLTGVKAIEAGEFFSVALKNDGTVVAWGENYYGQTNIPQFAANATSDLSLLPGDIFVDPNAIVTDNIDVTVTNLAGEGTVDTNTVGTYTLTYSATDAAGNAAVAVERTVNVLDVVSPIISVNGGSSMDLNVGDTFVDPYATVTDNVDATITNLAGVGTVDTSTAGNYTLTYNTTDQAGNIAIGVKLYVYVSESESESRPSPESSSITCPSVIPLGDVKLMPMYALMLLGMFGLRRRKKA